jgi:flagellar protein FliT
MPGNPAGLPCLGANMTSNDVLSMYENLTGLSSQMKGAAEAGDWTGFDKLNVQASVAAGAAIGGVPALEGNMRQRKIDLLKQLMANDRAIRDVTEPWMGQLDRARCVRTEIAGIDEQRHLRVPFAL